jgi:hypothetical protein
VLACLFYLNKFPLGSEALNLLACFFGRQKTSGRPGATTVKLACLFYLNKFPLGPAAQELLACFFGGGKTSNAGPVRSEKARQSNALACLFYLKERAGLQHGVGSGNKKSPAISDGGLEAFVT